MTKQKTVLIGILLGFAIISCNENKSQNNIIGKWEGKLDNTCPDRMFSNGAKSANYEFKSNGKVSWGFSGNNGETDGTITMSDLAYKVEGDSLILYNDTFQTRVPHLIKFDSQDNLILTMEYTDSLGGKTSSCKVTTQLHRKSS